MITAIKNARVITPYEILENHAVIIEDGKIAGVEKNNELEGRSFDRVIDAGGNYLSPGFIDIHNHGNSGHDVMDSTFDALDSMARFHAKHGVTGFLATTITSSVENIEKAIRNVADYMSFQERGNSCTGIEDKTGTAGGETETKSGPAHKGNLKAGLLGIYLEGPYFSMARKGAQPAEYIKNPSVGEVENFIKISRNTIRIVALAPELPGAPEVIFYLKSRGITVSAGHTDAGFAEAKRGIDCGITQATHIFNGMRGFSHREPGAAGAFLTDERVACEMICDGVHLHPAAMRLVSGAKGKDGIILISDAMMACGLSDGEYELGGQKVMVKNGQARLADGTLAGSTLTMNKAVYNMVHMVGVSLCDAVRMATLNPARACGLARKKGSIEVGKDADLVIFDDNVNVIAVIIGGKSGSIPIV
ncbi:N-acetylglucosamine-6-phosphate deacetylase [Thermoanaerobacterium sp. DL9XJH110]|uniref:N-acetylglucosamine-6-phosphate deacetylase n=1 Tax=Thermoanaerobacterium sp. DL9XJH110 TaxID=3386643 RepID=UPI003BB55553